jgi:hypothetical protein
MKRRSFLGLLGGAVVAPAIAGPIIDRPAANPGLDGNLRSGGLTGAMRMAVIGEDGRIGFLAIGDRVTIEGDTRVFEVVGRA